MPRVPILEPRVQRRVEAVPTPQSGRMPEEAFGGGVQRALGQQGQQIEKVGDILGKHAIEMARRESEKNALEIQTQFQNDLDKVLLDPETDENGTPKGFLNRKLSQANDASIQYDNVAQEIYGRYSQMPVSPELRNSMQKTLESHLNASREKVIRHEADQREMAAKQSLDTYVTRSIASSAGVADVADLAPLVDDTTKNVASMLSRMGQDKDTVDLATKETAGKMLATSVNSILESDPKRALALVEGMKDKVLPKDYFTLKNTIDGKMYDDKRLGVWDAVSGFKLADGNSDLTAIDNYVNKLDLDPKHKIDMLSFVHSMASVADTKLKDQRLANERSFTNELVKQHQAGLPYTEALKMAARYGYDSTDIANKQKEVVDLYSSKITNFDAWINKQPEETQAAWAYATETVKGKYGNKMGKVEGYANRVKLADAAIAEMKQQFIGKTPEQIRQLTNEKMKNVVVSPGWLWDTEETGWKVDAATRNLYASQISQLEKDYGADAVSKAKAYIVRYNLTPGVKQVPIVPENIKAVLDKTKSPGAAQ